MGSARGYNRVMLQALTDRPNVAEPAASDPAAISTPPAADDLCGRIRSSRDVRPVFIVGPPRSGTTLIAQILAHGENVLSLSEPFFAWRVLRPCLARAFFHHLQRSFRCRTEVPRSPGPAELFEFMLACARRNGHGALVIKEVFHHFGLPAPWYNVDLLDAIADSGAPVIATLRDPFDAVASTAKLVRRFVYEWRGHLLRLACPALPRFTGEEEILHRAALNWARYADWIRRRGLFVVRYEALTGASEAEVKRVCTYAAMPFDEQMLTERRRPAAFAGLGDPSVLLKAPQPIHSRSIGRGRSLSEGQRRAILDVCGEAAAELGYHTG